MAQTSAAVEGSRQPRESRSGEWGAVGGDSHTGNNRGRHGHRHCREQEATATSGSTRPGRAREGETRSTRQAKPARRGEQPDGPSQQPPKSHRSSSTAAAAARQPPWQPRRAIARAYPSEGARGIHLSHAQSRRLGDALDKGRRHVQRLLGDDLGRGGGAVHRGKRSGRARGGGRARERGGKGGRQKRVVGAREGGGRQAAGACELCGARASLCD
jgi:hypothetical protein